MKRVTRYKGFCHLGLFGLESCFGLDTRYTFICPILTEKRVFNALLSSCAACILHSTSSNLPHQAAAAINLRIKHQNLFFHPKNEAILSFYAIKDLLNLHIP